MGGLPQFLPEIAEFMGLPPPSAELSATVLEFSSFEWMSANDHLFDDNHIGRGFAKRGVSTPWISSAKVGLKAGDGVNSTVSGETVTLLAQRWREVVTPV